MKLDAVVVGIDGYRDAPLRGCVNDASDITECLTLSQYSFNCIPIHNSDATRSNVLAQLGELAYGDGESGTLIFYFAGHGQVLGDQGHLVMFDGTAYDPGISLAHLGQLMESASSSYKHVIVILDCCHAGSAYTWTNSRPISARDVERDLRTVNESRCILAACRPEETSIEVSGHGAFTEALVTGLLGDAANQYGEVTVFTLHEFVDRSLQGLNQTPVFKGDISGTVVLGAGFTPTTGNPLSDFEIKQAVGRGQALLDSYQYVQNRELDSAEHKDKHGLKNCSLELEPIVMWFEEKSKGQAALLKDPTWIGMQETLRNYSSALAPTKNGQSVRQGTIRGNLGVGGFGSVWLVRDVDTEVAYKVFHPSELHDEIKINRFRNGYKAMRKLEHPRIVGVHDLTEAPLGIVMDYIDGKNLRDSYIDRSDASLCLRIINEICETVEHAHSKDVLHRDIKPENIIIKFSEDGVPIPYLTDFDLAYHQTNRTVTAMYGVGGVLSYAAPEQLHTPTAKSARSPEVDVYSLGQLGYYIITGEDPASDSIERNKTKLERTLKKWTDPRAVKLLYDLYVAASQREPSNRPESVGKFKSIVSRAEAYVNSLSADTKLSEYDFIDRVAHSYRGVGKYTISDLAARMLSLSGQVSVTVRSKGQSVNSYVQIDVEIEISVTGSIPIAAYTTGANARRNLNQRLDRLISRFKNASRHPGNAGSFQTFVAVKNVPLTTDGVADIVDILSQCVGCVDGA